MHFVLFPFLVWLAINGRIATFWALATTGNPVTAPTREQRNAAQEQADGLNDLKGPLP